MKITAVKGSHPTDYRIELSEVPDKIISEALRWDECEGLESADAEIRLFAMIELMIALEQPKVEGLDFTNALTDSEIYEAIVADMDVIAVVPEARLLILKEMI